MRAQRDGNVDILSLNEPILCIGSEVSQVFKDCSLGLDVKTLGEPVSDPSGHAPYGLSAVLSQKNQREKGQLEVALVDVSAEFISTSWAETLTAATKRNTVAARITTIFLSI